MKSFFCLLLPLALHGATITVGTSMGASTGVFGLDAGSAVLPSYPILKPYQQLYNRALFGTSMIAINGLAFSSDTFFHTGNGPVTIDARIQLGTAAVPYKMVSQIFAENRGIDLTTVFDSSLTFNPGFTGAFDLIFPITPFVYNPLAGDLLLEVTLKTTTNGNYTLLSYDAGTTNDIARAYISHPSETTRGSANPDYGYVTQFTTGAVPEPNTLGLMGIFLGLVAFRQITATGRR